MYSLGMEIIVPIVITQYNKSESTAKSLGDTNKKQLVLPECDRVVKEVESFFLKL